MTRVTTYFSFNVTIVRKKMTIWFLNNGLIKNFFLTRMTYQKKTI